MKNLIPNLPKSAWLDTAQWVAIITLFAIILSPLVVCGLMLAIIGSINFDFLIASLVLPVLIVPPTVGYLAIRHQQLKLTNAELSRLAYRDGMLDCMNRHGFTTSLDIALEYASPHRPCALLIIDADHFKQINDQFGHVLGDEALKVIVSAIKNTIRAADILGRIGGEEFGIFLPGANEAQARTLAQRVCLAVATAKFTPNGTPCPLSVSIGGAVATEPTPFATLFHMADQRLYAAKNAGRNRIDLDFGILKGRPTQVATSGAVA